jgi:putative hydrolase of the HAD superfamily
MIRNIVFDLGNVLINYDFDLFFIKAGYARGERSLSEAHETIRQFECGELGEAEFLYLLQRVYNAEMSPAEFKEAWCDVFEANSELISAAGRYSSDFRLMILSNNDELHFPYIWSKFPELHIFSESDIMITSRLGYIKPDRRVYLEAVRRHDFFWEESVFIDDVPVNLEAARDFGAITLWHQDNYQTLEALGRLLGG